ncbi:MAG: FeoB-associated Cys-rich membrane protein [Winogradskyella sp.]|nr:MAG: FeoB-associated Cys-rich membrane protein [Winogradskyella sp.]
MNDIIQNILVFSSLAIALLFLIKKFVWASKKKAAKACGSNDCGCH